MRALERSSILKHEKEKETKYLSQLLQSLLQEECRTHGVFADDIVSLKKKLEALDTNRYKGAMVRARSKRLSLGEIPTKRALVVEKTYASKNEISEILYHGTVTSDKEIIECAFVDCYKELFSFRASNKDRFQAQLLPLLPKLEDDMRERLKQPIMLGEIEKAIANLKIGKSPGLDDLGGEFYKAFKEQIAPSLYGVFREVYGLNCLPPSFLYTHTIFIPKGDDANNYVSLVLIVQ